MVLELVEENKEVDITLLLFLSDKSYKSKYINFINDCIYSSRLENIITFKDYCEYLCLEEQYKHRELNNYNLHIEDNKDWF